MQLTTMVDFAEGYKSWPWEPDFREATIGQFAAVADACHDGGGGRAGRQGRLPERAAARAEVARSRWSLGSVMGLRILEDWGSWGMVRGC
ncbi:MAG: hypothetical protein ACYC6Y_30785 [Thermoguttaceae bacterium]